MHLHENLKLLRKQKHMTQEEVSTALEINRSTLAGYEKNIEPPLALLIQFSSFYDTSIDTLLKEKL